MDNEKWKYLAAAIMVASTMIGFAYMGTNIGANNLNLIYVLTYLIATVVVLILVAKMLDIWQ